MFTGMPSEMRPTSVSSIWPLNIKLPMSATVAMVVPSLKLLLRITLFPTFTGTSSISPSIVERIRVVLMLALLNEIPSRTIFRASRALDNSSCA